MTTDKKYSDDNQKLPRVNFLKTEETVKIRVTGPVRNECCSVAQKGLKFSIKILSIYS